MLVHGEKKKMGVLAEIIRDNFNLPVLHPANFVHSVLKVKLESDIFLSMPLRMKHMLIDQKKNEK